jgi:hypothetical protein
MAMGLDADALKNTTATAASAMTTAYQSRMELVARMLANGMRDLFRLILKLSVLHQDRAKVMRLRGQWVTVDPRVWSANMDVTVSIGLGRGTDQERLVALNAIKAAQEQILGTFGPANPIVSLSQYSNTLAKMVEMAGFRNSEAFVTALPPDFQMPPAPPPQDPNAQAAQMLAQVEQQKAQMKMQVDQAKLQADTQIQSAKLQLEREKAQADAARKELELQVKAQQVQMDVAIAQARLEMEQAKAVLEQLRGVHDRTRNDGDAALQEASGDAQQGLMAEAIVALGTMIERAQLTTAQAMAMPKRVLRDQSGRVVGVEPVSGQA